MNQPWPLKELTLLKDDTTVIPFLLSGFAFAYVIGYFLAFDLAWLPFFSLSEHIVFALRALPFAVAALVALLFAKEFPHLLGRVILVWICVLWAAAVIALMTRYFGLFVTFAVVAVATRIYYKQYQNDNNAAAMPYLAAQLMILSLMVGYLSGTILKADGFIDDHIPHWFSRSMHVHLIAEKNDARNGHVVFVGDQRILFYDYALHKVLLYQWKDVAEVHESDGEPLLTRPSIP
jgi:hypothetical protein